MKNIMELGPGIHRSGDTTIAVDKHLEADAEIIRDFAKRGIPFADNTFDEVRSYNVIEHIELYEDLIFTFNEIWRVLKSNGIWHFTIPDGVEASVGHLTHHRAFNSGSFVYLMDLNDMKDCRTEYEYMKKSDGIVCSFKINWIPREGQLEGRFIAVK